MSARLPVTERKREIEKVALDLAFKVGPMQVTTGMIAAEMGLSQPALYKHFASKKDVWLGVSQYLSARIMANVSKVQTADINPIEQIRQLVAGQLKVVKDCPALPEFMVIRDASDGGSIFRNVIQDAFGVFRAALMQNVKASILAGDFKRNIDAEDATALIIGVIQSLVLRMLVTRNPAVLVDDGERLLELQLAGFSPKGE